MEKSTACSLYEHEKERHLYILTELFWLCSEENFQCECVYICWNWTGLVVLKVDTDILWARRDKCLRVLEEEKRNRKGENERD